MKTRKMNLNERIKVANRNIEFAEKEIENDLLMYGKNSGSVKWDINQIEWWTRYLRNTCKMHGIEYKLVRQRR